MPMPEQRRATTRPSRQLGSARRVCVGRGGVSGSLERGPRLPCCADRLPRRPGRAGGAVHAGATAGRSPWDPPRRRGGTTTRGSRGSGFRRRGVRHADCSRPAPSRLPGRERVGHRAAGGVTRERRAVVRAVLVVDFGAACRAGPVGALPWPACAGVGVAVAAARSPWNQEHQRNM